MKIYDMLKKDINRDINGVIKVAQDDDQNLVQEFEEYIITKELRKHFNTFFDNYTKAIHTPTDKIGVWISGFFGSGKSHFLKILSYLLSNNEVAGKKTIDYFEEKFDDPITYANIKKSTNIPTESILFNIDIEGPMTKDKTAVMRVFAKVFYKHIGFYGDDLKIAKLEQFIDKQGKTIEFREKFEEVNGSSWIDNRASYAFFEDDIVTVLQNVLGMSEISARNWFNSEENIDMSIKQLVNEIKLYVDNKGQDFRLLFCVDEVGQYIGDDGDLMINLQSIVEELGDKCRGKVWVMVTSQEAIDSVVNIKGDDFSKIQGRFNTRLSLSSASVDEVIKKRILEKTEDAERFLQHEYDKKQAILKNLYVFNDTVLDIKGYSNADEFSATYPFIPYQFIIIQKVLAEIRKHGNSGKHLSGGERSMLSGFQEAAQTVQDKDENALISFAQFYDTVHTFLESSIRRVIDRCQNAADNNEGLESIDVSVLKLLYLIRYIDDITPNINNIAILMINDINTDKIELRREIAGSLDRLVKQNYVARNGDNYSFLTDEEQDIAKDISNTIVDNQEIVGSIGDTIFNDIYPFKKYRYNGNDFAYEQYIDEKRVGSSYNSIYLRFITDANDNYSAGDSYFLMKSKANNEATIILSNSTNYFVEIETAAKIRKYIKQKNMSQLSENIQDIINKYRSQAKSLEDNAKRQIEKAIIDGTYYIHGNKMDLKQTDVKAKLDEILKQLIDSVYSKLTYMNIFAESDIDIYNVLNNGATQQSFINTGANNGFALTDMSQWLEDQSRKRLPVTMGSVQNRYQAIPYGWREIDIAVLVARLIVSQKIEIRYGGILINKDDKNIVRYLRNKNEVDKVNVNRRIAPSEELIRKSIKVLRDWLEIMDIPNDEDGLIDFVESELNRKLDNYNKLLDNYKDTNYPQKEVVEDAISLINNILSTKHDNVAFLEKLLEKQDDLLDSTEDMEEIINFFKSQKNIYDAALKLQVMIKDDKDCFSTDTDAVNDIKEISNIFSLNKPYDRIKDLPGLTQNVRNKYNDLLNIKKGLVLDHIKKCMSDVNTLGFDNINVKADLEKAGERFTQYKQEVADTDSLTLLDAMIVRITDYSKTVCKNIELKQQKSVPSSASIVIPKKIVRLSRYDLLNNKRFNSREDIDKYIDDLRDKLYNALDNNDGIDIN